MAVGGIDVGVSDGRVVGKIWVGVGSRVAVAVPTTKVGVTVGAASSSVGDGVF